MLVMMVGGVMTSDGDDNSGDGAHECQTLGCRGCCSGKQRRRELWLPFSDNVDGEDDDDLGFQSQMMIFQTCRSCVQWKQYVSYFCNVLLLMMMAIKITMVMAVIMLMVMDAPFQN